MSEILSNVKIAYKERFNEEPILARAPGRINLIGEHTDYNDGFVLPAAVHQSIYFAVGKSSDDECHLLSLDLNEMYSFKLSDMKPLPEGAWQNYILGVVSEILKTGRSISPFNMVFSGDIPRGSGMSSSAALECGTCAALNELFDLEIPKVEMVKLSQKAEHNYAKVMCGIMDQFASVMGESDHAILLDCRSLDFERFPIALRDYTLLLCNSNVSHSLASSEYNVRRAQCEEGVGIIRKSFPDVRSLRDVLIADLESVKASLSAVVYLRCKYVIEENDRVHTFASALTNSDFKAAGEILKTAQSAMRDEYEITCPEIDFIADFANNREDVLGARMMGGGFGGCTLNLIRKGTQDAFVAELSTAYQQKFNKDLTPIEVKIGDGAGLIVS